MTQHLWHKPRTLGGLWMLRHGGKIQRVEKNLLCEDCSYGELDLGRGAYQLSGILTR